MAIETVTLPRATLDQIRAALATAIDVSVAIQDICRTEDDGLLHGCVYAIEACIARQEDLICPAQESLDRVLEASHV